MEMFLRKFKSYRQWKGGKWWLVLSYDKPILKGERNYIWLHSGDLFNWPEHDGLIMENVSWFHTKIGSPEIGFYTDPNTKDNPTEDYTQNFTLNTGWFNIPDIPWFTKVMEQQHAIDSKIKSLQPSKSEAGKKLALEHKDSKMISEILSILDKVKVK